MKSVKIKPKGFKGEIELEVPNFLARNKMLLEAKVNLEDIQGKKMSKISNDNFEFFINMIELSKKYWKKVNLEKEGVKYSSFDDIMENLDNTSIYAINNEVLPYIINGVRVGGA